MTPNKLPPLPELAKKWRDHAHTLYGDEVGDACAHTIMAIADDLEQHFNGNDGDNKRQPRGTTSGGSPDYSPSSHPIPSAWLDNWLGDVSLPSEHKEGADPAANGYTPLYTREAIRQSQSLPAGEPVAWWNGARESKLDDSLLPSVSWTGENTHHDIPLFAGCNPHSEIVRKASAYDALQSLPAGAVAGLVGKWNEYSAGFQSEACNIKNTTMNANWLAGMSEMAGRCADELAGALQADAREKGGAVSPEDRFEQYVAAGIARSPAPLRELGEYLGRVLDEDQFESANRLLLQLATQPAQASEKDNG